VTPLVSILIPCHNAGPWLAQTLESALAQDWPAKEIILVDDGSTDDSLAVARTFAERGVAVISQSSQGAGAARNAALAASEGEWIQYLDADDLLAPDKIGRQMRLAADVGPDRVLSARWARFVQSPAGASLISLPLCVDATPLEWVMRKLGGHDMMHPAAWLVSRRVVERAGAWDTRLSLDDDGEYFTRVVLASQGVRYCPEAVSFYRSEVRGSLSRRRSAVACESAYLSVSLCAHHLLAVEDSTRTRQVCADMFLRLCHFIYPDSPEIVRAAELEASRYGGSSIVPPGGVMFGIAVRLFGWKAARRMQLWRRSVKLD
jgi:glycosyltransferase involved in cell wall biosynthesis